MRRETSSCRSTSARRASSPITAPDAPVDVMITLQPMNICQAAADLLWSRVLQEVPRHPLRALRGRHRLDPLLPRPPRPHLRHAPPVDRPGLRRPHAERRVPRALPHLLHRRPGRRPAAPRHRHRQHRLGVRLPALRLVVARTRPRSSAGCMAGVPDDELHKITYENACRWYSFDPFAHRSKEQSTVGALRAEAAGHDVVRARLRQGPLRAPQGRRPRRAGQAGDCVTDAGPAVTGPMVKHEIDGGVATITLDDPAHRNALSFDMTQAIAAAVARRAGRRLGRRHRRHRHRAGVLVRRLCSTTCWRRGRRSRRSTGASSPSPRRRCRPSPPSAARPSAPA